MTERPIDYAMAGSGAEDARPITDAGRVVLARLAVRSAKAVESGKAALEVLEWTEDDRAQWEMSIANHEWAVAKIQALLPDADLFGAYQRTGGQLGDEGADAIAAEIERRGLTA